MAGNLLPAAPGPVPAAAGPVGPAAAAGPVAGAECTVCGWRWGREVLPSPRCYVCGDAPAFHHGRCCRLRPVGLVAAAGPVASAAAGPLALTGQVDGGWALQRRERSRPPRRAASESRRRRKRSRSPRRAASAPRRRPDGAEAGSAPSSVWLAHVVAGHANAARHEEEDGGREGRIHVLPLEQCAEWLQDLAAAGEEYA